MSTLFTKAEVDYAVGKGIKTPWETCSDSEYDTGSRQAVSAATEYAFENDCAAYNEQNFPAGITKMWNATTNKIELEDFLNNPSFLVRVQFMFEPTVASAGHMDVSIQPDNVSPDFVNVITIPYKATETKVEVLFSIYLGAQAKTDGLKITYTPSSAGEVWDRDLFITN